MAVLLLYFALSASSIALRPEGTSWSAWWPAAGVAIAFACRFERRRIWPIGAAVGAAQIFASLLNGREFPIAFWAGLATAAEVYIGAAILRSRLDRKPRLDTAADVSRLLACAFVAPIIGGAIGGLSVAAVRGVESYLPFVVALVPSHAVGILLLVPLVIFRRNAPGDAGPVEAIGIWIAVAVAVGLAFGANVGLPIAFLACVPLTWGATRLAPRNALGMIVIVVFTVTVLSLSGRGSFAVGAMAADVSVLMVHLFALSFGILCLTLIVLAAQRRRLTATVLESATLFHTAFNFSPVGSAIISKTPNGTTLDQLNAAGRDLMGLSMDDSFENVRQRFSDESQAVFSGIIGRYGETGLAEWRGVMTTVGDKSLQVLVSRLPSELDANSYAVQFFDVTDELRTQQAASEDLLRAGEVQRALLPKELAPLVGYDVAGACVPAKTVGGDFYDWYRIDGGLAFSIGDVMGKGVGAGMIAATTRAALRSARHDRDVTVAVARAADTLSTEVAEANSFTTLFHARLRAKDGALEYVDAGHGLAIILRADSTAHRIASVDVPLGILADSSWTTQNEILHPGDTFIAFSDGVLDLYDGTLAALGHVAELARGADSPSELAAMLTGLAQQNPEPADDSTILVIRRND